MNDTRITTSMMRCKNTCARMCRYAYRDGLRPNEKPHYFRTGDAHHLGMELNGLGVDIPTIIETICDYYEDEIRKRPASDALDLKYEQARVVIAIACYIRYWKHDEDNFEIVNTELPFELPIINPETGRSSPTHTMAGKIDKVIRIFGHYGVGMAIMEHKTTICDIDINSPYIRKLRIDTQITNYVIAANELLEGPCAGVLYDITRKPPQKPKTVLERDKDGHVKIYDESGERVWTDRDGGRWITGSNHAKGWRSRKRQETPSEYGERIRIAIQENPAKYFQRYFIARIEDDIVEARQDMWQTKDALASADKMNAWPRNDLACLAHGQCAYFDICTEGGWEPGNAVPDGFHITDDIHQELNVDRVLEG